MTKINKNSFFIYFLNETGGRYDPAFVTISSWSREYADHNEEFISFKQRRSEELKDLYKHLDNIQKLKTSYLTGR